MNEGFRFYNIEIVFNTYVVKKTNREMGHNHVNETARNGIIAHHQWEENLGNVTKIFVNDFSLVRISLAHFPWRNPSQRVNATKSGIDLKESLTKASVTFPKFSSQKRWATIPSIAVSFT